MLKFLCCMTHTVIYVLKEYTFSLNRITKLFLVLGFAKLFSWNIQYFSSEQYNYFVKSEIVSLTYSIREELLYIIFNDSLNFLISKFKESSTYFECLLMNELCCSFMDQVLNYFFSLMKTSP